jgi:hypothetical protein
MRLPRLNVQVFLEMTGLLKMVNSNGDRTEYLPKNISYDLTNRPLKASKLNQT